MKLIESVAASCPPLLNGALDAAEADAMAHALKALAEPARLRLLSPFPGIDPPRRLDVYDIDDALFLGSTAEVNRRYAWAKQEAVR